MSESEAKVEAVEAVEAVGVTCVLCAEPSVVVIVVVVDGLAPPVIEAWVRKIAMQRLMMVLNLL